MADNAGYGYTSSPVILIENGVALKPHSLHEKIRQGEKGLFSHWGSRIIFSPYGDGYPFENKYTLIYPIFEDIHIYQFNLFKNIRYILWFFVIVINCLAAWIVNRKFGQFYPKLYRIMFIFALLLSFYFLTVYVTKQLPGGYPSGWNVFYVSPDSGSYAIKYSHLSIRPPVYMWFIQLVAGPGFKYYTSNYLINEPNIKKWGEKEPLWRVAKTQKVLLIGASLIACYVLMGLIGPVLPPLVLLWLYDVGFFCRQKDFILSETLAQVWVFLIIAVFFQFLQKGWKILLPLIGFLCAALYLTRPAGVYGVVFLIASILWALRSNWRANWFPSLIALIISGGLALLPQLNVYHKTGEFTISNMAYIGNIGHALQLAEPGDVSIMPDEESKQFLIQALEKKKEWDEKVMAKYPEGTYAWSEICATNAYRVALPVAGNIFKKPHIRLLEISKILIKKHWLTHIKIALKAFMFATSHHATRLSVGIFGFFSNA